MQARDLTRWDLYRRIDGVRSALFFLAWVTSLTAGAFAQENPASSPTPAASPTATAAVGASPNDPLSPSTSLQPVVVTGRQTSLVNIAGSASEGVVGQDEISERPLLRPGEVLETVPGMIVTQHAGGGKANQFFLRGYNLDHGTDFSVFIDGAPMNLPSHAHGEGYDDLNILIPELIDTVNYNKGVYNALVGDFSSAGSASMQYFDRLPANLAIATIGENGYERVLLAVSHTFGQNDLWNFNGAARALPQVNPGTLLGAIEWLHNDGPFTPPENFRKLNGFLRYSIGSENNGFSITATGYSGAWTGENQLPLRAILRDEITYFGNLDPFDGGDSQRYILSAEWHGHFTDNSTTKIQLYAQYYDLDLFSDFTYFLNNPVLGDQFEQADRRFISGFTLDHKIATTFLGRPMINDFGLQIRDDDIFDSTLNHTYHRNVYEKLIHDSINWFNVSSYFENRYQWTDWFRAVIGIRGDLIDASVTDLLGGPNGGVVTSFLASPKLQMIFGPWYDTEFYVDGGFGYHTNDARGATSKNAPLAEGGGPAPAVPLMVQQKGGEIGLRTTWIPGLQSTIAYWFLFSKGELTFDGDTGDTVPGPASVRYGLEISNYYSPTDWLTCNVDFSQSQARFIAANSGGQYVPESVDMVIDSGIILHSLPVLPALDVSLRWRFFGPRELTQSNAIHSEATSLFYLRVGYQFSPQWSIDVDVFNLLNTHAQDI
ncbi:MAG TPA: TonB-dependent receptor plug domain-containing protein, partial [Chthoniobacterales bacterium]|nr:TonB-dependent receptor plug domain-containing protein [Chthoniobacterales bacterium]